MDNTISVIFAKQERDKKQALSSVEMELQRLRHITNTMHQHLLLLQQKNTSTLTAIAQPVLETRNLTLVTFSKKK